MDLSVIHTDTFKGATPGVRGPELVEMSLLETRNMVGEVLLPSFVPTGYALDSIRVFNSRDVFLTYFDTSDPERNSQLSVGLVRKARHRVPGAYAEQVTIGSGVGYLIRGGWVRSRTGGVDWNSDVALTLTFQHGAWVVVITALGGRARAISADHQLLVDIGESLEPAS